MIQNHFQITFKPRIVHPIRPVEEGMGDRLLVTLAKSNQELGLPWTRLKVGSPIVMSSVSDRKSMQITESKQGVVSKRGTRSNQEALADISPRVSQTLEGSANQAFLGPPKEEAQARPSFEKASTGP